MKYIFTDHTNRTIFAAPEGCQWKCQAPIGRREDETAVVMDNQVMATH